MNPCSEPGPRGRARCFRGLLFATACALISACSDSEDPASVETIRPRFLRLRDMTYVVSPSGEGLLLDRFEVTDGEYHQFLGQSDYRPSDPTAFLRHWQEGEPVAGDASMPVRFVSLEDATAFAQYHGKSLPTALEWLNGAPGLGEGRFPWTGRGFVQQCNVLETGVGKACAVGVFEGGKSAPGCYDLIGNVAEWTVPMDPTDESTWVLGGSFNTSGAREHDREPRQSLTAMRYRKNTLEAEAIPSWHSRRHRQERAFDIGFRCVIRRADQVLESALSEVSTLSGGEREAAILELLEVGRQRRGPNRLLPFVAERDFRSRVLWSVRTPDVGALLLAPVPLDATHARAGEDILVVSRGLLQGLSARDGSEVLRVELPEPTSSKPTHGIKESAGDRAWFWTENEEGAFRLVELPSGQFQDLEGIPGAVSIHAEMLALPESLLFLQCLEFHTGEEPVKDRVRLQRVSASERTPTWRCQELLLEGRFLSMQRVDESTVLLLVEFGNPVDNEFDPGVFGAYVVDLDDLRVRARREFRGHGAVLATASSQHAALAIATVDSQGRSPRIVTDLHLLGLADLDTLDRSSMSLVPGDRLLALTEPLSFLVRREAQNLRLMRIGPSGDRWQPVALQMPRPVTQLWWKERESSGGIAPWATEVSRATLMVMSPRPVWPLFLSYRDGDAGVLDLSRLQVDSRLPARLTTIGGSVELGDAVYDSWLDDQARTLVILTGEGLAVCMDLISGAVLWRTELGREDVADLRLLGSRSDRSERLLVGRSPFEIWWRSMRDGQSVDRFGVRRAPLDEFLLADVRGDRQREWVVSLSDSRIVHPEDAADQSLVVALGPPRGEAARLLRDFRKVWSAQTTLGEEAR